MTFADYVNKYLNRPNPATGRAFWYDGEVAQAEKTAEKQVAEMRAFAQSCAASGMTVPQMIEGWTKRPVPVLVPTAKASGVTRKIGDVPENEFWERMRTLG